MSRLAIVKSMPAAWEGVIQQATFGRWPGLRRLSPWIALVLALGVFLADWFIPENAIVTMCYVIVAVIALGGHRRESLINIGLLCLVLTIVGHFVGASSIHPSDDLVQRGCSMIALVLSSWLGWQLVESSETVEQLRVDSCLREMAEEAATFFRSMVDHVPIGISRTDLTGRFVFVNDAFCQMFGVPADDLLGRSTMDIIPRPLAEKTAADDRRVVETRQALEQIELVETNEREQFMKVIRTPVEDARGQIIGIQAVWLDVTELKTAQHVLERHTKNLERTNVDLKQFAYVASHDLQEPLRAVSSYCQLLEKQYADKIDERGQRWLEFVTGGAKRMQTLVRDLLTYASVDNKAQTESWITVNCQDACQHAVANLSLVIQESQAQISIGKLPSVWANATQIELLFQNLIANAIKFRDEQTPKISISAQQQEKHFRFAVQDNGIGIKPEFHERVFEIFKRLESREQYSGTGIGLAICKRIVERFGGKIWIESERGHGCTFFFTLPSP